MQALWDACDAYIMAGSATTKTTIEVSDLTDGDRPYTVELDNVWDSYDITWDPAMEVLDALWTLGSDPDGVLDVRLDSVDFQATISTARKSGRLVDIALPGGLKTGDNIVRLSYYGYGSRDLMTQDVTLTLPAGKPVNGDIEVMPAAWSDYYEDDWMGEGDTGAPATLAEIVDELNGQAMNSDLILTFYPREEDGGGEPPSDMFAPAARGVDGTTLDPVEVTVPTQWVFQDMLYGSTIPVELYARPARVTFGRPVFLSGAVYGVDADVTVTLVAVDAATGVETPVETVTAVYNEGEATFETVAAPPLHNTTYIARVGAVGGWLPGSADDEVAVRAAVRLTSSVSGRKVTLKAAVRPADTGGKVAFQRYSGGRWRTTSTVAVSASGSARATWTAPGAGTYRWRAKFLGSTLNLAQTSAVARVVVR
jgi:hypothetical protein